MYTIKLRSNAYWHDGVQLTAKDVAYTVNLMKNPDARSPLRINWLDVSVKAVDATTVEFQLPAVYAAFPYALTFPVLPEHILGKVSPGAIRENTFSQAPVGSGPFVFQLLQSGDTLHGTKIVHMIANDRYYDGPPKLDRFEIEAYGSEADILRALKTNEINGATDISISSSNKVNTNQYTMTPEAVDSGVYILFNTQNPVLKDQPIRHALQLATDTAAIRKQLGNGVLALDLPFIDNQVSGTDVPHAPAVNLVEAGALLDQAGWTLDAKGMRTKDGQKLTLVITTTKDREYGKVAEMVAKQWHKLGIDVSVQTIDVHAVTSTFVQDTLQGRNFQVLLYELAIGADPDVYAYWHSSQIGQSGYNFTNYSSKTADASLSSARSRLEPGLRNAKYKQFARDWLNDVPAVGLYQPVLDYVSHKHTTTVVPGTRFVTSTDRFANILDWSVVDESVYKTP